MTELHWLGVAEIARAYRERSLSPVTLVTHLIERIDQLNPVLAAFISVDREGAIAAARAAEQELAAGHSRSLLHGIPVAIKDMIDVAGIPTTCHSRILTDNIATQDAAVIHGLRRAGAIILGKTALHEFGAGGPAFDLPFPPARNPWNVEHHPGGSSSGSGVAVAAGLSPLALGTDNGGSVRHPASACGIVGLKPTAGLVSRDGVFPASETLDELGPMARSAEDIAVLLEAMVGADVGPSRTFSAAQVNSQPAPDLRDLRIGFVRHFHESDTDADPEVVAALETAAELLRHQGADVQDVVLPGLREMDAVCFVISQSELASVHASWLRDRPEDYCALTRRAVLSGQFLSAGDYIRAKALRIEMQKAIDRVFENVDVLLTASSMYPACAIHDHAAIDATYGRQARSPFSMSGHPALSLMSGLSSGGLPLSLQLVAPAFAETTLLRTAHVYGITSGWQKARPPCDFLGAEDRR